MATTSMDSSGTGQFQAALSRSPAAFAYFDMSDRLRAWNKAYEDLNYRIKPLIREGARFPDLLSELVVKGQVDIPEGETAAWIARRLECRRVGGMDFRKLSDGRTFLCQESHDEIGGTLGVWIDVTHLFERDRAGALRSAIGRTEIDFYDPGYQNSLRESLKTILSALELLRTTQQAPEDMLLIDQGLEAAEAMGLALDVVRERGEPVREMPGVSL